ncbi:uncharacterized protein EHS24_006028 [Apiotrichum porosum]|uniref:Short-chain dehydrogenase/reductase 3 n=1 Tax=Apiotrichum porosum TaxID=105984 RepID=A0A427Y058_9TREE|nr:uncharacterized protein EHS24_006028 [Apiotrichum porosum]RSH84506.1 hypothetical protein EHS24_006028 [Apiotrichum porosum]
MSASAANTATANHENGNGTLALQETTKPPHPILSNDDLQFLVRAGLMTLPILTGASILVFGFQSWVLQGALPAMWLANLLLVAYYVDFALPQVDFAKETVLITGGATGLGKTLADKLLARGAKVVVLTDHIPEDYVTADNSHVIVCDVSDRKAVAKAGAEIREKIGTPTMLVNNAGVVNGKLLLDLTEEDIMTTFKVNSIAPFWMVQEFLPDLLRERKGHIVNVSSVLGLIAVAQMTDYCASKAATVAMHACLRNELDYRYNTPEIRTTLVLPGHILTAMFEKTIMPRERLFKWLAPSLTVDVVADAIVSSLEGGPFSKNDTVLRLPFFTHTARLLSPTSALVPGPILKLGHWCSGADWAMKSYGPTPDAGERLELERAQAGDKLHQE